MDKSDVFFTSGVVLFVGNILTDDPVKSTVLLIFQTISLTLQITALIQEFKGRTNGLDNK